MTWDSPEVVFAVYQTPRTAGLFPCPLARSRIFAPGDASNTDNRQTVTWRGWIAFVALCVIWGVPYFFVKLAVAEIPPVGVAWGRIALGAAILLPVAWKRGALRSARLHKRAICAFAFAELVVPFSLIALGERWISSSLTGILIATLPLIVVLLAPLFGLNEPLGVRRLVGLVVGFIGVVVLLGVDTVGGPLGWAGVACILVSTVGYAVGPLIVQRHLAGVDELGAVAASLVVAAVALLPGAAVVCTALAMLLYFFLIAHAGAARAAVITYINPAVAVVLGVGVLHESLGTGAALGLVLILLGSWLATGRAQRR
ncbi:MAG: EamA family transporter [Gammaproteobacteria bacterium]|nr:MAG: EamA family transporter [Gammaproteobacteria bacterium]